MNLKHYFLWIDTENNDNLDNGCYEEIKMDENILSQESLLPQIEEPIKFDESIDEKSIKEVIMTDNPTQENNTANFNDLNVENLNINSTKEKFMNDCTIARESTVTDLGIAGINATENIGLAADATAQRGFNHADGTAQRMAIAELDAIERVAGDVSDSSRVILKDIHDADNHISAGIERHGLFNAATTERTADKTQAEVEKFGLSELEAIRSAEQHLYTGLSQNAKDILMFSASEFERVKLQAAADTASIKQQQYEDSKQLLLQNCGDTDKIMSQAASQFKDILLQNCNDTASIKMQAEILGKDAALAARDLMHQADKNTAAIQMEAFRHKDELARQIAECCCEQKALTLETSHHTQDLIRKLDEQRLRDELAKTREELIALRVRSTLTPALVGATVV